MEGEELAKQQQLRGGRSQDQRSYTSQVEEALHSNKHLCALSTSRTTHPNPTPYI